MGECKRQQGFTLLEVMVAAVILFAAISLTSLIFKTAYLSGQKANSTFEQNAYLPIFIDNIKIKLRHQHSESASLLRGEEKIMGVTASWQATEIARAAAPESGLDLTQGVEFNPARFALWDVTLRIKSQGVEQEYRYKEVTY
ncbi:prepilin-type N-terminal cleavage/methylation domain-containing protein [Aestuariibacter sp. AA17]|uniref:Prepilin-type N-terminal cleavage/methylation domain-containing protein n=1 Tax=Fluctibacter corallii TaxID=2984329 RepID=A0ABT3A3N0_9ALTE|nr:prepilin-type N-terminal cleavage/methylation domain-containing protein [Aestuariibacter sp. AA17]MCV2883293.1 prepilin-type N-terminal cleavage/methylation domain-containing protein [Aestuariibacter sp. AA17]